MSVMRQLSLTSILCIGILQASAVTAQTVPNRGYLCCNLWVASHWADDGNKHDPSKQPIPAGTPVIPLTFADNQLKFEANGQQYTLANYYSTGLTADQFVRRWVVSSNPRSRINSMPAVVQKEIRAGRVMRGMTRAQVAMALGYPTATNTPQLEVGQWKYVPYSGYDFLVLFDEGGRVRGVQSDDPGTRAAMYSPTPVPVAPRAPAKPAAPAAAAPSAVLAPASAPASAPAQVAPVR